MAKGIEIKVGQVWRDTYFDGKGKDPANRGKRTVRVKMWNGEKWTVELVTDNDGRPPKGNARQTRVSEKTLRSGYELVQDVP